MRQEPTKKKRAGWQRALIVAGAALLPCCLVCLVYSEWGPSVGFAGLVGRLARAAGFAMFGVSMSFFFVSLAAEVIVPIGRHMFGGSYAGARKPSTGPVISEIGSKSYAPDPGASSARMDGKALGREIITLILNLLIYGGGSIMALGAFTSLDRGISPIKVIVVVAVCVACIAAIVLWRRHRVRSGVRFTALSNVGVFLFFAALALVGLVPGAFLGSHVAYDLVAGPRTEICVLQEFNEHHPAGRLAGIQQDTFSLVFVTETGNEAHVTVAKADKAALVGIAESSGEILLTYYPQSEVLVSAKIM